MKKFVEPSMDVEKWELLDVITTSAGGDNCDLYNPDCPNETMPFNV